MISSGNERILDPSKNQVDTIADGTRTVPLGTKQRRETRAHSAGEITFPIIRANVEHTVLSVTDDDLRKAMVFAFEKLKVVLGLLVLFPSL